jgi:bacillithiol biosynthesis deacetylase BshB1
MKLDILAIAVHPDDVELGCSGALMVSVLQGKKAGILDLTRGELGTRGTPEGRLEEAAAAAAIMGIDIRDNAGMADGFFRNDEAHQKQIIPFIRKYRPDVVLANAVTDRHPDHGRASELIAEACFYSGLRKVETFDEEGRPQAPWRPGNVFHFIQDRYIKPDFIVDISEVMDRKIEAITAFKSQFFVPSYKENEPQSYISSPDFLEFIKARAREMGHAIGVAYGEGFTSSRALGVRDITSFL